MIKQIIIMRTRYPDGNGGMRKVRTGKMIAQGAHASMKVLLDAGLYGETNRACGGLVFTRDAAGDDERSDPRPTFLLRMPPEMAAWLQGKFTKVVVGVETEAELLTLRDEAHAVGLPHALIQDAGDTEFGGVSTYTALAIGPANADKLDPITGHLKLL